VIEDENSWPDEVVRLLNRSEAALREYISFNKDRYVGARSSAERRRRQALVNPLQATWDSVLAHVGRLLEDCRIIACHCTRLTADEVTEIRERGLHPLSAELCREKVLKRVNAGELTQDQADALLDCATRRLRDDDDSHRTGRIWATLGRTGLMDEDGFGTALSFWGGEIMLEGMPYPASCYGIGEGCIIEFHLPAVGATLFPIQEAFVDQYLFARGIGTKDGAYDVRWSQTIPPTDIVHILTSEHADFERLTRASQWQRANPFPTQVAGTQRASNGLH
jgi:hypothetical protein